MKGPENDGNTWYKVAKQISEQHSEKDLTGFYNLTLSKFHERMQEGDKFAILEAIQFCCGAQIPVPEYFAEIFSQAIESVKDLETDSLDQAFGFKPIPHGASKKKKKMLRLPVYYACILANRVHGAPLSRKSPSKNAFEYAAEEFEVSSREAETYYNEINQLLPSFKDQLQNPKKK